MNLYKSVQAPFRAVSDLLRLFIVFMPGGFGFKLRYRYYKTRFKKCGKNVLIDIGVAIDGVELISVGDNVHIDKYCVIGTGTRLIGKVTRKPNPAYSRGEGELVIGSNIHIVQFCVIMAYGGVEIGDNCTLSSGAKIYSLTNLAYDPDDRSRVISIMPYEQAPFLLSPVVLGQNVWVGLNSVLMPGVCIDENSFVVSNSLVLGCFPENSYLRGTPAQRVRARFCGGVEE